MRKIHCLLFILLFAGQTKSFAQDSIYFYKAGKIKYAMSISGVDSLSMKAPKYYNEVRSGMVMDYLKANASLSIFTQMIQIAHLTDSLDNTCIWAPTNNSLSEINLHDTLLVKRTVKNHIARFQQFDYYTLSGHIITTLNGKHIMLASRNNQYYFGSAAVTLMNHYVAKSVVNVIEGYAAYQLNLWEFMTENPANSLLSQYLLAHNSATNPDSNDLKNMLPQTVSEDSISTVIVPTNSVYTTAYAKLYPYCKTTSSSSQDELTKLAILHQNFFRGVPDLSKDYPITNINYRTFNSSSTLLKSSLETALSNGKAFVDSTGQAYSTDILNQEYRIEAEDMNFGKSYSSYTSSIRSQAYFSNISNGKYLQLTPSSSSSLGTYWTSFEIPNVYSRKYNIYVVVVPGKDIDTTDVRPYKLKIRLNYPGTSGKTIYGYVTSTNTISTSVSSLATFTTDGKTLQKLLVISNFEFPCASLTIGQSNPAKVNLIVQNAAGNSETATYNRNMGIDCIIFEPVP